MSSEQGLPQLNLFVIEHEPDASVGRLAPHLAAHQVTMVRPAGGDALPPTAGIDGVIVLGGSMGAYEVDEHPWLVDEKAWIAQVASDDVPMLGICLGAQLLADATGGRAFRSERRVEAGVYRLHPTEAGRRDAVMPHAGDAVFAVHGDTFELPPDATLLASSDDYIQAFRVGSALGVQFHPETDANTAIAWAQSLVAPVLEQADVTLEHFTDELRESEADLDASSHRFFDAWIDTLGSTPENAPD
ncbi:MAG: type 1 glutamine amidotransferase [Candidatus Microthrix sp.]|nr:type 1 glutamine amidotransferase [Candidatus Microthrix sp.]